MDSVGCTGKKSPMSFLEEQTELMIVYFLQCSPMITQSMQVLKEERTSGFSRLALAWGRI